MSAAGNLTKEEIYTLFPQFLGRYTLQGDKAVGESSGFGAVWKAHDSWLTRDVAIKISDEDLGSEIALCRDIDGETVRIFDYYQSGVDADYQAYAMELLETPWVTLSAYIKRHKYKPNDIQHYFSSFEIIRAVLAGLKSIHGRPYARDKIVHADIKPGNIFLLDFQKRRPFTVFRMPSHGEFVKIIDLGISVLKGDDLYAYTPGYRPADVKVAHPGCDLYALAVTFIELLTGKMPALADMADKRSIRKLLIARSSGADLIDELATDLVARCKNAVTQKSTSARSLVDWIDENLLETEQLPLLCLRKIVKEAKGPQSKNALAELIYPEIAKRFGWRNRTSSRLDIAKGVIADLYKEKVLVKMSGSNLYSAKG